MKYPLLNDKDWLFKKYIEEELSTSEMASLIGSSKDAVRFALIKFNIPLRTAKETLILKSKRKDRKSKYPLLNDKDWLFEKYIEEELSTNEIADLLSIKSANSVRQALLYFNIKEELRKHRNKNGHKINDILIFNDKTLSVMNGCLLGDAGLSKCNKMCDNSSPSFYKKNKFFNHVEYVGKILMGEKWKERHRPEYRLINGKNLLYHRIDSLVHKELLPIYKKWYPEKNNYKKVIPDDLEINEIVLLHWWLDDGSSSFRKDKNAIRSVFCSESFSKEDQECLIDKINSKFKLDLSLTKINSGSGYRISIKFANFSKFLNLIGECPIPDLSYKWKFRECFKTTK